MSEPQTPQPAKLVIGLITNDKTLFIKGAGDLIGRYGTPDMISKWFPFDYTSYYEPEMGHPLFRRILAFKDLIPQSELAGIKCETNKIEHRYSRGSKRSINIDPGYLLLERFVLATGKNYSHRIYIGKKIYADLTLIYTKGKYQTLPWTYPDYAGEKIRSFLIQVRKKYALDLRNRMNTDGSTKVVRAEGTRG